MLKLLDRLLLVFILVELIFAVRTTLARREIVAEPFLIVGIIVSIKEIILLSVEVANVLEGNPTTEGTKDPTAFAVQIGLLGLLVIVLSVSVLLLRMKEREPVEGQRNQEHDQKPQSDVARCRRAPGTRRTPSGTRPARTTADQNFWYITCSPTRPWARLSKASGTIPIVSKPSECHSFTATVLLSTTALNCML